MCVCPVYGSLSKSLSLVGINENCRNSTLFCLGLVNVKHPEVSLEEILSYPIILTFSSSLFQEIAKASSKCTLHL